MLHHFDQNWIDCIAYWLISRCTNKIAKHNQFNSSLKREREKEQNKRAHNNYSWSDSKCLLNSLLFIAVSYRVLKCLSLLLNDLVWNVINTQMHWNGKPSGQPAPFRTGLLIDFEFMSIHLLCTIIVIIIIILVTNSWICFMI